MRDLPKPTAQPPHERPLAPPVIPPAAGAPRLDHASKLGMYLWRTSVIAILALAMVLPQSLSAAPAADNPYNISGKTPFVLAHYMDWFTLDAPRADGAWDHWAWKGSHPHDPSHRLPNGQRDIASVLYPLIGPYDSADRQVVRYHLATMHAAGISGIIIDWYGKGTGSDECLPVILDEADKLGMKVALCYEEQVPCKRRKLDSREQMVDSAVGDLTYLLTQWASHPAYLRRDGKPWIMQFNSWGNGPLGPRYFSPAEDIQIFNRLPERVEYCRENLNPNYSPSVAGGYIWAPEATQGNVAAQFGLDAARLLADGRLEFFMSRLAVGFNDSGVWGWGNTPRISKFYGITVLKHAESQALVGGPELIQCVTWNDFNESTCFEPTVQHGFAFVDEVARFIARIHGGPVQLQDIRRPYQQYVLSCSERQRPELPKVDPALLQPQ